MTDPLPVTVKPITRTGSKLYGQARRLGKSASASDVQSKYEIQDGYIIRANRALESYNVFILDPAAMIMHAGHTLGLRNELGPVGARDDFFDPDGTKTYKLRKDTEDQTLLTVSVPAIPAGEGDNAPTVFDQAFAPVVLDSGLLSIGYRRVPMALISSEVQMDTYDHFTFAQNVSIGLTLTTARESMVSQDAAPKQNYLALNVFWISERELTGGWAFQQRRLINRAVYPGSSPYAAGKRPPLLRAHGSVVPSATADGEDKYQMVAEVVRQYRQTWSVPGGTYYDILGEHGLLIGRGTVDRRDFDREEPQQLRADIDSMVYVTVGDIPRADIRPQPATFYGFPSTDANDLDPSNPPPIGVPTLTTYSWWLNPMSARYSDQFGTEGFATFCVYWAPNHTSGANGTSLSYGQRDATMAAAILVIDNDNEVHVLKADFNDPLYTESGWQPIDGAEADKFVNPWLIGVESVKRTDPEGGVKRTAYALVWEEWQYRGEGGTSPDPRPPLESDTMAWVGSASIGGEFVLYIVGDSGPARVVLGGEVAALMHPNMGNPGRFEFPLDASYFAAGNTSEPWWTDKNGYGACQYMGDNKLVTACIPNELFYMYTKYSDNTLSEAYGFGTYIDPHMVSCMVVDTVNGTIEVRGPIKQRVWSDEFCTITCAQWMIHPTDDVAERPAVLLAGFHTNIKGTFPDEPYPVDTVYLSVDGGWTWRLYVEDYTGENGPFLIGNQLWVNDPSVRIDTGEIAT